MIVYIRTIQMFLTLFKKSHRYLIISLLGSHFFLLLLAFKLIIEMTSIAVILPHLQGNVYALFVKEFS